MSDSIIAIVPAAGVGARASQPGAEPVPKQYRPLAGQPMLRHAVRALLADERVSQVRVAVTPGDGWVDTALAGLPRTVWRACGGATRADTVAGALADSGVADDTWVLVHDAARPGLPESALRRLIDACLADPVGGLLALPVADTVKGGRDRVERTLDRNGLWLAQTPQMFRAGVLRDALTAASVNGVIVTDEASALEAAGYAPLLVPGALRNFKVTWPDDFELMEKWL
ncbi:2-C-methyl-D-erythritol 4-phosphate cytidylyltransferase [Achromobacter spanius]|uniref:2-C-methyl-D-erythritol 4-phosphate cytidylyltransferase n=1 Tax=Achromobacter spanius TaxID=217203 RepID=UPI000C2BCC43|nr:2-C-methyl-D-erythritol 4-phosphate cytidylyltransferase [Achromobacter spanius]AUA59622.1 2-C-methyl-D-erythritol 4-phosphate cytidylyltransferase [Achromobacter spanius]CAB3653229.1 2-C-methyl-D-erythritol 4-phosphate cytidylyltransferase [Achromobacter spanius]SPT37006.1 2-C-methyl-D-erythritol 4-phosphate cytidylyltransferase [Achromobacter denitrificans]VEE58140.1 2-C-methyl-D-erythritol 4-phosphate cytidylyltransferase [Achromobacter spanius]